LSPIKDLSGSGWLKDIADNFALLKGYFSGAPGLGDLKVARFEFDLGVVANRTVGVHGTGITIPANAIVMGGVTEVNTAITGDTNATLAQHVQGANDIITAAAVAGAPWSTTGRKAIVPKINTPETTGIKLTAAREITFTVGTAALLTGKITGYLIYVEGVPTA
jgi:hypothetical protein